MFVREDDADQAAVGHRHDRQGHARELLERRGDVAGVLAERARTEERRVGVAVVGKVQGQERSLERQRDRGEGVGVLRTAVEEDELRRPLAPHQGAHLTQSLHRHERTPHVRGFAHQVPLAHVLLEVAELVVVLHPRIVGEVGGERTLYHCGVESLSKRRLVIVTGRCHPTLAKDIADQLGVGLTEANLREFANGEIHCRFDESIRGAHVFIVQTHSSPVNDAVMEQLIMIDAAKRASARSITAVIPNYGYARQDRKSTGREPITAKLIADMLQTAGANRVLSVDFHSGQIQGFFDIPVDHLVAAPVLEDYLKSHADTNTLVVVAPDAGRVKVAERYAQHLGCDLALVHKTRPRGTANVAEARHIVGDVAGRHCVLIDDMIDTAGTIVAACDLLKAQGAGEIWVMATHALFSPPAVDRLFNAPVSRVIVTDTLPLGPERRFEKLEILSVANIVANAISAIFEDSSVSDIFGGENLL